MKTIEAMYKGVKRLMTYMTDLAWCWALQSTYIMAISMAAIKTTARIENWYLQHRSESYLYVIGC